MPLGKVTLQQVIKEQDSGLDEGWLRWAWGSARVLGNLNMGEGGSPCWLLVPMYVANSSSVYQVVIS